MSSICPGRPGTGFLSSGSADTSASVVSMGEAIELAFCSAVRTTLVGSIDPSLYKILELSGLRVVAKVQVGRCADLAKYDRAFFTGVALFGAKVPPSHVSRCRRRPVLLRSVSDWRAFHWNARGPHHRLARSPLPQPREWHASRPRREPSFPSSRSQSRLRP